MDPKQGIGDCSSRPQCPQQEQRKGLLGAQMTERHMRRLQRLLCGLCECRCVGYVESEL